MFAFAACSRWICTALSSTSVQTAGSFLSLSVASYERNALLELVLVSQVAGIFLRLHFAHVRALSTNTAEWRSNDDLNDAKSNCG